MDREWLAGDLFCRFNKVGQTFAITSSNFVLVSIAVDRWLSIVYPLRIWPSPHRLALVAWIASLLPSLPNAYTFHQVLEGNRAYCVSKFYTGELSPQVSVGSGCVVRCNYMAKYWFTNFKDVLIIALCVCSETS